MGQLATKLEFLGQDSGSLFLRNVVIESGVVRLYGQLDMFSLVALSTLLVPECY